jgi:hypothetical protein
MIMGNWPMYWVLIPVMLGHIETVQNRRRQFFHGIMGANTQDEVF